MSLCVQATIIALCVVNQVVAFNIHRVCRNESVILDCVSSANGNKKWKFGESVLYYNKAFVGRSFCEYSMNLSEDYSLLIPKVDFGHEGDYYCLQGSDVIASHRLIVESKSHLLPTLS